MAVTGRPLAARPEGNAPFNGDFTLWQRGEAATLAAIAGTPVYVADCLAVAQLASAQGLRAARQATGLAHLPGALRLSRPAGQPAAGAACLVQAFERAAIGHLAGTPV